MDLISAFKSELFRPLTTIVVPGSFVAAPWWLVAMARHSDLADLVFDNPNAFVVIFLVIATAIGFLLENIGARIEGCWDRKLNDGENRHIEKWNGYLQLETKDEIVGQRYLQTIVTRMKFELAFAPALILASLGMLEFNRIMPTWDWTSFLCWFVFAMGLSAYLLYESFTSADTAAKARDQVIAGVAAKRARAARIATSGGKTGEDITPPKE